MIWIYTFLVLATVFQVHPSYSQPSNSVFKIAVYNIHPGENPGGYHGIRKHIIEQAGYTIEFMVVPAKRMPYALKTDYVDAISVSGLAREIRNSVQPDGFLQSKYPDRVVPVDIYYKESPQLKLEWPPNRFFKEELRGVSINYSYLNLRDFNIMQIPSYSSGAMMVGFKRADYWLDVIPESSPSYQKHKRSATEGYLKQKLFDAPLFLLFADTDRGREFKRIVDTEMERLLSNPELYEAIAAPNKTPLELYSAKAFLDYMSKTYSELTTINQPSSN